jgi:D-amino-acid oxidase
MSGLPFSRALVIGAGVNGLTCARALLSAGVEVELWARELTLDTTSATSAAFWYPFSVFPESAISAWSVSGLRDFRRIAKEEEAHGVREHKVVELFPERLAAPGWREILTDLREARPEELRAGRKAGWVFTAPVVDTTRYLPWLLAGVEAAGATIQKRSLESLNEALAHCPVVINTSGFGARELAADPAVHAVRGELVRLPPLTRGDQRIGGVWLDEHGDDIRYIVPRENDTILGGTFEPERMDAELDSATAHAIMEGCSAMVPEIAGVAALEHKVGWRPSRHEVRLEVERRPGGLIGHNYGHGGAGVTLSWGCARDLLGRLGVSVSERPWTGVGIG